MKGIYLRQPLNILSCAVAGRPGRSAYETAVSAGYSGTAEEFAAALAALAGIPARVETLETGLTAQETGLTTLETNVAALETNVTALGTAVTALETGLAALESAVTALTSRIAALEQSMGGRV